MFRYEFEMVFFTMISPTKVVQITQFRQQFNTGSSAFEIRPLIRIPVELTVTTIDVKLDFDSYDKTFCKQFAFLPFNYNILKYIIHI